MDRSTENSQIYSAPKSRVDGGTTIGSPWLPFWIAFAGYFLLLPVIAYLIYILPVPNQALLPLLLAIWWVPISLASYLYRKRSGHITIGGRLLIYLGLTAALAASLIFWFGAVPNFLSNYPIEMDLPQRR